MDILKNEENIDKINELDMKSEKNNLEEENLIVLDKKTKIEVKGNNFEVRISKFTGDITSIMYNSREFLVEPIRVQFGANEVNEDIEVENVNTILFKLMKDIYNKKQRFKVLDISTDYDFNQAVVKVSKKVRNLKNELVTRYCIDDKGNIEITNTLTPKRDIYRFGTTMTVCKSMDMFSWVIDGKSKSRNKKERCKLIDSEHSQSVSNKSSLKYKIKAKKSNVRHFLATDESGNGLLIEGIDQQPLSVRANYNSMNVEENSEKLNRIKESIVINIEYREKDTSKQFSSVNYEEEYKLKRNNEYVYTYKISNAI